MVAAIPRSSSACVGQGRKHQYRERTSITQSEQPRAQIRLCLRRLSLSLVSGFLATPGSAGCRTGVRRRGYFDMPLLPALGVFTVVHGDGESTIGR